MASYWLSWYFDLGLNFIWISSSCELNALKDWAIIWFRARRFPLPDGRGQVKLPVGQTDLDGFFFFILYKQIEEFHYSWSLASDDEKRQALWLEIKPFY